MRIERTLQTGILAAILLVAAIYLRPTETVTDIGVDKKNMYINKAHYAKDFDMVLAGDSRMYCALSPAQMKKLLVDEQILNFGFANTGFGSEYLGRVEEILKSAGNRRTIVLGVSPYSLTPNSNKENGFFSSYRRGRLSILEAMYVKRYLKLVDPYRFYYLWNRLLGRDAARSVWEYHSDGWVAVERTPEDTLEGVRPFVSKFDGNIVSDEMIDTLMTQVSRWTESGITVIGFRPPANDSMIRIEESLSGYIEEDIRNRFVDAGGIWFDFDPGKYHSYDGSHLGREAALLFSNDLASFIVSIRSKETEQTLRD